jgi:hypothetical protein
MPRWPASPPRRALAGQLEYHLLGNHLFADAKALIFLGAFFAGAEAEAWLTHGLLILARELPEQVLADGGHFERSPMIGQSSPTTCSTCCGWPRPR